MHSISVGISSCLLGNKLRYDGSHALDLDIKNTLGQYFQWLPICPETEYGLSVPREPMILKGNIYNPRLVTIFTELDHTDGMLRWAAKKNGPLKQAGLCGYIFKSKSPSCGLYNVKIYQGSEIIYNKGIGLFSRSFTDQFPQLPVIDEVRLHDPSLRKEFIEGVMDYDRLRTA